MIQQHFLNLYHLENIPEYRRNNITALAAMLACIVKEFNEHVDTLTPERLK